MNNAPSSQAPRQFVFASLNGAQKAWVYEGGKLTPVHVDVAQREIRTGQGVEIPVGAVLPAGDTSSCGCGGGGAEIEVEAVAVQKTETLAVLAGRGRLLSGTSAGEPLMAVAEGDVNQVACCGEACGENAGTPNALVFDRYRTNPAGGYDVAESTEYALPKRLAKTYAHDKHSCLPFVRVQRDPEAFRACMAQARAIGPIRDSKDVAKLLHDYMMRQDSETFLVVLLDVQLQCRGIGEVARGARDKVDVPVPDVLRLPLVDGATAIVIVHNHPSGVAKPSESDVELTKTIKKACETVHIELIDHVILAGDKYYSFSKSGKL